MADARHGDACVYFGDEMSAARLRNRLGRTATTEHPPQEFVHIRPDDVFVDGGPSPIGGLIALRNRLASEALAASRQVRLIVMPGADAVDNDQLRDRSEAFESMFTGRDQPPHSVLALCLYDARRYPADFIELASAAHPWTMRDGRIVANPLHAELLPSPGRSVAWRPFNGEPPPAHFGESGVFSARR